MISVNNAGTQAQMVLPAGRVNVLGTVPVAHVGVPEVNAQKVARLQPIPSKTETVCAAARGAPARTASTKDASKSEAWCGMVPAKHAPFLPVATTVCANACRSGPARSGRRCPGGPQPLHTPGMSVSVPLGHGLVAVALRIAPDEEGILWGFLLGEDGLASAHGERAEPGRVVLLTTASQAGQLEAWLAEVSAELPSLRREPL